MVCDWAKALFGLGELCWLLNLAHKGDIQKDNHAASVGQFNVKGTTIGHHLTNQTNLAHKLAAVVGYFDLVVNENFCLFLLVHNHVSNLTYRVGHP